jgi:catechol 2,3-dioxygenase-like lactoylglutathione lyase family enzyme
MQALVPPSAESAMLSRSPVAATLPCRSLKAALTFYTKKLGLKLASGSVKDGYLELAAGSGTTLLLFESDSKKSEDTAATFEVVDLDKEMKALAKRGVKFVDYDLPGIKTINGVAIMGDHKGAWIKDPGGNILGLHQRA